MGSRDLTGNTSQKATVLSMLMKNQQFYKNTVQAAKNFIS